MQGKHKGSREGAPGGGGVVQFAGIGWAQREHARGASSLISCERITSFLKVLGGWEGGCKGSTRGAQTGPGGEGGPLSTHLECSQLAALHLAKPLSWSELLRTTKEIQPSAQSKLDHVAYPVI